MIPLREKEDKTVGKGPAGGDGGGGDGGGGDGDGGARGGHDDDFAS